MPSRRGYKHPTTIQCTLVEGDIPAAIARKVLTTHGDILVRGAAASERLGHGTDGQFLKTQGAAAKPVWADVTAGGVQAIKPSDVLQHNNSTERDNGGNINVYVKAKETLLIVSGQIRISFELKSINGGNVYGRIYKNGVAFGSIWSTTSLTFVAFTEDLFFSAGDLFQVYVKAPGASNCHIRNQKVLGTIVSDYEDSDP